MFYTDQMKHRPPRFNPEFGRIERRHISLGAAAIIGGGMLAGSALSGYFGSKGAKASAAAYRGAADEQAAALREIHRWGYGYPEWLRGEKSGADPNVPYYGLKGLVRRAEEWRAPSMEEYVDALRRGGERTKELLGEYVSRIPTTSTAQAEYARFLRGAEETFRPGGWSFEPWRGGGYAERRISEEALPLAIASLREKAAYDKERLAAELQMAGVDAETAKAIAEAEAIPFLQEQEARTSALQTAVGLPSRAYSPPWPGVQPGAAGKAAFWTTLGRGVGDLGYTLGMQYALSGNRVPWSTPNYNETRLDQLTEAQTAGALF